MSNHKDHETPFTMNTPKVFCICVIAQLVATLISTAVYYIPEWNEDWKILLQWSGNGSAYSYIDSLLPKAMDAWTLSTPWYVTYLLQIAASIGLLFHKNWARFAFPCVYIFYILETPFTGLTIMRPLEGFFGSISWLLGGIIVGLSFSSPVSQLFEARPTEQAPPPLS